MTEFCRHEITDPDLLNGLKRLPDYTYFYPTWFGPESETGVCVIDDPTPGNIEKALSSGFFDYYLVAENGIVAYETNILEVFEEYTRNRKEPFLYADGFLIHAKCSKPENLFSPGDSMDSRTLSSLENGFNVARHLAQVLGHGNRDLGASMREGLRFPRHEPEAMHSSHAASITERSLDTFHKIWKTIPPDRNPDDPVSSILLREFISQLTSEQLEKVKSPRRAPELYLMGVQLEFVIRSNMETAEEIEKQITEGLSDSGWKAKVHKKPLEEILDGRWIRIRFKIQQSTPNAKCTELAYVCIAVHDYVNHQCESMGDSVRFDPNEFWIKGLMLFLLVSSIHRDCVRVVTAQSLAEYEPEIFEGPQFEGYVKGYRIALGFPFGRDRIRTEIPKQFPVDPNEMDPKTHVQYLRLIRGGPVEEITKELRRIREGLQENLNLSRHAKAQFGQPGSRRPLKRHRFKYPFSSIGEAPSHVYANLLSQIETIEKTIVQNDEVRRLVDSKIEYRLLVEKYRGIYASRNPPLSTDKDSRFWQGLIRSKREEIGKLLSRSVWQIIDDTMQFHSDLVREIIDRYGEKSLKLIPMLA
jgi:hypothetical protein